MKKDFLKDAKLGVDFEIDGENFDPVKRTDVINGRLNDPNTTLNREELELELLSINGVDDKRFQKTDAQKQAEQEQAQQEMAQKMQMPQPQQRKPAMAMPQAMPQPV
jgi:hypothetical protein